MKLQKFSFKETQGKKTSPSLQYCGYWFYILLINSSVGFLLLADSFSLVWKYGILSQVKMKESVVAIRCN